MRLMQREAAAIVYYRSKKCYSMNQIAQILQRSTRTVKIFIDRNAWIHKLMDLRRLPHQTKRISSRVFQRKLNMLQWCCYAFLMDFRNDIEVLNGDEPP